MYRITTISALDGKPTTKQFASADAANKVWQDMMQGRNRVFYLSAVVMDGGRVVFAYTHPSVSAATVS